MSQQEMTRNRLVGTSTFNDTVPTHENLEERKRNLMGIND